MAQFIESNEPILFRVTGKQSIERLEPLLLKNDWGLQCCPITEQQLRDGVIPTFVWETTCEKEYRTLHQQACLINRLHNSSIIESKANMAFLQLKMNCPTLETHIASNGGSVRKWFEQRWGKGDADDTGKREGTDWWAVKASNGNGGKDIWIVNQDNYSEMCDELRKNEEYVIQQYVAKPLLFGGKKFHFRCYSAMRADFTPFVYEKAFILSAGLDFSCETADLRSHVTNLSVNKHFENHPGQVPCNLPKEFPHVFEGLKIVWSELVKAAAPYMEHQAGEHNFEFFGVDVIADENGVCWLIEANRLPGLESSNNNKQEEDAMYDEMMTDLLTILLSPLRGGRPMNEGYRGWQISCLPSEKHRCSFVGGPISSTLYVNLFKWKAYTITARSKVVISPDTNIVDGLKC